VEAETLMKEAYSEGMTFASAVVPSFMQRSINYFRVKLAPFTSFSWYQKDWLKTQARISGDRSVTQFNFPVIDNSQASFKYRLGDHSSYLNENLLLD